MCNKSEVKTSHKEWWAKVAAASFYAAASFLITTVNKVVLTTYKFPSYQVLGIGQMVATVVILFVIKRLKLITFPNFSREVPKKLFPLPVFYLGNLWFGLGGTKSVSLPMFTALRRFSVLMTMALQYYVLGTKSKLSAQLSVYGMVVGALVAASSDMGFEFWGYLYIIMNNVFTAANNVFVKKKVESKDLGRYGVMFYNAVFMLAPVTLVAWHTGDIHMALEYPGWLDLMFVLQFVLSCVMGFILTLSIFLCTSYTNALTTTVIGCLKNILVTYLGMFIGGDYIFNMVNFMGLNISVVASLYYTYVVFFDTQRDSDESIKEDGKKSVAVHNMNGENNTKETTEKSENSQSSGTETPKEENPKSTFLQWIKGEHKKAE